MISRGNDYLHLFICPSCGAIKDSRDEGRMSTYAARPSGRYCHAYAAHGGGSRRMKPCVAKLVWE